MSDFHQIPDSEPPDDPLDQLLSEAEWPEPDAEAVQATDQIHERGFA